MKQKTFTKNKNFTNANWRKFQNSLKYQAKTVKFASLFLLIYFYFIFVNSHSSLIIIFVNFIKQFFLFFTFYIIYIISIIQLTTQQNIIIQKSHQICFAAKFLLIFVYMYKRFSIYDFLRFCSSSKLMHFIKRKAMKYVAKASIVSSCK